MWERLSPFIYMILAVVTWIVVWGIKRRSQLRRTSDPRQLTSPLTLEEHAASLGLDPNDVERWRASRIVTVEFNLDRISAVEAGSLGRLEREKLG